MTSPNRQLPVLYAAINEATMRVEYTSEDRKSTDAVAFACDLKTVPYPPPTQMREVERLLEKGDEVRATDECYTVSGNWVAVHKFMVGKTITATDAPVRRRETIAQGPARCGTCPFCNRDAADEEGRSYCLPNVRLVRANEYCSKHPRNQEREGRG